MSSHFTHLHIHTDFSLLDGAITVDKLVDFGKKNGMKAIGISDHGNIFGAVKFFQTCKKAGIKPILGMEAYITEDASIKNPQRKYYHAILIVKNEIGYKNLCKLISFAYQKGFYFKPRIDYAILEQHKEGLIISSACLGGHIPQLLMSNNDSEAEKIIDWHLTHFGPEHFYLEVQPEDQKEQSVLNQKLYHISEVKGIPLIATGDCHYVNKEDRQAHEIMLAIQTQDKMSNASRYTFGDCRVHIRTQDEMLELFKDHQEAVWNTGRIADSCSFEFQTGKLFFPKFEVPSEHTPNTFFTHLCNKGLQKLCDQKRIPHDQYELYQQRLELEAKLIIDMGFVGYFLVVSDFIQWARAQNIPVGPGRGSAAGSLVAWALEITNIDPIKYNLLFERFLNPERITMPDIDIDFCIEGRETVINYIRSKYGNDKVGQIITFGTMMAKGVIKDVARALGFPFEDSNAITSLIPDQLKITLTQALEQEPRLTELIKNNPRAEQLFDIAFKLEGLTRHASKHAAGIVISPDPIDEVLPVYIPSKSDELVTQYAMTELESLGFLKIDLLGLKNLTLIDRVVKLIKQTQQQEIDINLIPLDDQPTFTLISEGKTSGVFQLESTGLKEVLRKLQPSKFEDIIAVNALYRPGPLGSGMIDDYIERRHGRQKIHYLFPELAPILEETYGVIVYQEQVIKIASAIGGYSLGQADILRRAMGKKKAEVMAEQRIIFLEKSKINNFDQVKAGELFDLMAYFAGYGFNKSHSAAYALIAYQTAYLKAHYLPEFMACLISLESSHADKMAFYLHEAKQLGLGITPPDINRSSISFDVIDNQILFGLQGIKNVGMASLENIIAIRTQKPFVDLLDFCKRIDLRTSNKRVIEHFIYAGALDTMPGNRAQKAAELGHIMDLAVEQKKADLTGQMGLFGINNQKHNAQEEQHLYHFKELQDWSSKERLEKEKEVLGFYVSEHPLEAYKAQLRMLNVQSFAHLFSSAEKSSSALAGVCCGLITSKRTITTKKGDTMAFIQLEDETSHAEIVVFPSVFKKSQEWLESYTVFLVKGEVDLTSLQSCKIKANIFLPIDLFFQEWPSIESAVLTLPNEIDEAWIKELKTALSHGSSNLEFIFQEQGSTLRLATKKKIAITHELIEKLQQKQIEIQLHI